MCFPFGKRLKAERNYAWLVCLGCHTWLPQNLNGRVAILLATEENTVEELYWGWVEKEKKKVSSENEKGSYKARKE